MAVVAPGGGNGPPDRRPWNWKSYEKWDPPYADDDGDADDEEDSDDTDDLRRCHNCGKKDLPEEELLCQTRLRTILSVV